MLGGKKQRADDLYSDGPQFLAWLRADLAIRVRGLLPPIRADCSCPVSGWFSTVPLSGLTLITARSSGS